MLPRRLSLTLGLVSHDNGILDILPTCTFLMVLSLAESATNPRKRFGKGTRDSGDVLRQQLRTCFGPVPGPRHFIEFSSIEAIEECLSMGMGVALLPQIAVAEQLARKRHTRLSAGSDRKQTLPHTSFGIESNGPHGARRFHCRIAKDDVPIPVQDPHLCEFKTCNRTPVRPICQFSTSNRSADEMQPVSDSTQGHT
jgi:hypothetical protein